MIRCKVAHQLALRVAQPGLALERRVYFQKTVIRGFAVSLAVGLLANLFTSVYVSRLIFDWHLAKMPREAELSI